MTDTISKIAVADAESAVAKRELPCYDTEFFADFEEGEMLVLSAHDWDMHRISGNAEVSAETLISTEIAVSNVKPGAIKYSDDHDIQELIDTLRSRVREDSNLHPFFDTGKHSKWKPKCFVLRKFAGGWLAFSEIHKNFIKYYTRDDSKFVGYHQYRTPNNLLHTIQSTM